jgi:hypothetical protein
VESPTNSSVRSWFVSCHSVFVHAPRESPPSPLDLTPLVRPGLGEHRQQHDHSPRRDPVGDASCSTAEVKAELPELAVELLGMRLVEQRTLIRQAVNVESDTGLLLLRQRGLPINDLGLEFHYTPGHSTNAIYPPTVTQPAERPAPLYEIKFHAHRV